MTFHFIFLQNKLGKPNNENHENSKILILKKLILWRGNMKKTKKLTVVVANPKSDEYFTKKIEEINKIFKELYKVPKKS